MPHATTKDLEYEGFLLPRGTILIPNIPALSRHLDLFEEPDVFEPRRFLPDQAQNQKSRSFLGPVREHFQYGFGRRSCPGSYVADGSVYIALVRILWGFDITTVEGQPLDMSRVRGALPRLACAGLSRLLRNLGARHSFTILLTSGWSQTDWSRSQSLSKYESLVGQKAHEEIISKLIK